MKFRTWMGALVVGVLAIGSVALPAQAAETSARTYTSETELTDEEINQAREHMVSWYLDRGVAEETATKLADAFLRGEVPDSSKADAVPISEETHRDGNWVVTVRTFADGSISESRLEQPDFSTDSGYSTRSVGSCEGTSSGTGWYSYSNCRVEEETSWVALSFRADYTRSGGLGAISAVRQPYQWAALGTATTPVLSITRSMQNTSGPATAQGQSSFTKPGGGGSSTLYVYLYVNGQGATSGKFGF